MLTRVILPTAFAALFASAGSAQTLDWANAIGGDPFQTQFANATAVDSEGAVITIGRYVGSADLDPGPGEAFVTSNGDTDIFIQKVDAFGQFLWGRSIGGTSQDWGQGITIDSGNNVIVTGRVAGTVDLDPGPGTDLWTTPNTVFAVFVVKLSAEGGYQWGRIFGGINNDAGYDVAVDHEDNIITVGVIGGPADLDPGPDVAQAGGNGMQDIFVQKMDAQGNFLWGAAMGGPAHDLAYGVAIDAEGHIFVTGEFRGTADFDPGPGTASRTSGGFEDIFVLKLSADGALIWVNTFGSSGLEHSNAIAVGPDGGPVFTGRITSVTDFDPGPDVHEVQGSLFEDGFICKLDGDGALEWAFLLASFMVEGHAIAVDVENNVYAAGTFFSVQGIPLDLDPGTGSAPVSSQGGGDVWVASYGSGGVYRWGFSIGSFQTDIPHGIAVGPTGKVVVVGSFLQDLEVDPGPGSVTLPVTWGPDAFIAQYRQDFTTGILAEHLANAPGLFPNPASSMVRIHSTGNEAVERMEVSDAQGRVMMRWHGSPPPTFSVDQLSPGIHFVRLLIGGQWHVLPLVVMR